MAIMSQRAYARHRGVAVRAVQKAIQSGRIRLRADGKIDSNAADRQWDANTAPRSPGPALMADAEDGELPIQQGAGLNATAYLKARAIREQYQARLAKLEYEERIGRLVSKDEVKVATFNLLRQHRDATLNIADRVCAVIAAEVKDLLIAAGLPAEQAGAVDGKRVHDILVAEIRKALNDFSDSLNG